MWTHVYAAVGLVAVVVARATASLHSRRVLRRAKRKTRCQIDVPRPPQTCRPSFGRYRSSSNTSRYLKLKLEMFNCLQAEQTVAIRKCKFLNKFSVINSVLCQVFVVSAKKELESCCTDV